MDQVRKVITFTWKKRSQLMDTELAAEDVQPSKKLVHSEILHSSFPGSAAQHVSFLLSSFLLYTEFHQKFSLFCFLLCPDRSSFTSFHQVSSSLIESFNTLKVLRKKERERQPPSFNHSFTINRKQNRMRRIQEDSGKRSNFKHCDLIS